MELQFKISGTPGKGIFYRLQGCVHSLRKKWGDSRLLMYRIQNSPAFFINPQALKGFVPLKWYRLRGIGISSTCTTLHSLLDIDEVIDIKVHERTIELEDSKKQLESFAYFVAHDLKGPLRVINGYCTIIKNSRNMNDEERNEIMGYVSDSANKMNSLIDGLLRLAKVDSQHIVKEKIDMGAMALSVVEEMQAAAISQPKISLKCLPDASGDACLIKQIWTNLISNAIKYSSKNSEAAIEIGSKSYKGTPVYYVKDNGSGFDMKFSDKLFTAFQRLHSEVDYQGTGVGLALIHRIIVKHGGNIWARAKVNEGATFYFTL